MSTATMTNQTPRNHSPAVSAEILTKRKQAKAWRTWLKSGEFKRSNNLAAFHLAWNLLRGLPIDRGFTKTTNNRKLTNGCREHQGLYFAAKDLRWFVSNPMRTDRLPFCVDSDEDVEVSRYLLEASKSITLAVEQKALHRWNL